ncbi:ATP-binding cassette domain-containing protein [Streptomyces sp. NPDC051041]|uniref:ATP-binding cassette domain-containing protein n=1 Tax=Streptomyces sp. NPDC051041 TaxID=3365640 RepID=UPI0037B05652
MDGPHGLGVTARDLGVRGPRGWAFRGVRVEAEPGSLIALEGPSGSGRTCLLLTLTGRMRPTEGQARVGGFALPRRMSALRRVSAVAHVPGVTDLDPALTVGEHLRERALLQRRFQGSLRGLLRPRSERTAQERLRIAEALEAAGLDLAALPKGSRTAVRDLERLQALRLSVALALTGRPRLLGVDDTDLKLSAAERAEAWTLLRSVAEAGTTVVAVCREAPEGAVVVSTGPSGTPGGGDGASGGPAPPAGTGGTDDASRAATSPEDSAGPAGAGPHGATDTPRTETREETEETEETEEAREAQGAEEAKETVDALAGTGRA